MSNLLKNLADNQWKTILQLNDYLEYLEAILDKNNIEYEDYLDYEAPE